MAATKLVDKLVRELPAPSKGNKITFDSEVKGFGCRVTAAGTKAFVLNYRADGRERRLTIGSWPDWSTVAARNEAAQLKREIDRGGDPMAERAHQRQALHSAPATSSSMLSSTISRRLTKNSAE
jgi:Arm DNA-binding domain